MKLTKKKALEIAIELWEWMVDNPGKEKEDWPRWKEYGEMECECPFCEYAQRHDPWRVDCPSCPLHQLPYMGCLTPPCAYTDFDTAVQTGTKEDRHRAAVEFLAQLKELK